MGEFKTIIAAHYKELVNKLNEYGVKRDDVVFIGKDDKYTIAIYFEK